MNYTEQQFADMRQERDDHKARAARNNEFIIELRQQLAEAQQNIKELNAGWDKANGILSELRMQISQLRTVLQSLLDHYTGLVNSGDCGFWNPEDEAVVSGARKALKL